jgi:hypothetical protein
MSILFSFVKIHDIIYIGFFCVVRIAFMENIAVHYIESMGNMNLEAGHVKGLLLNELKVMVNFHEESTVCRTGPGQGCDW